MQNLPNGQIDYNQEQRPDGRFPLATYTCNSGYVLSGSGSNTCQTSTYWQQGNPTCNEGIKCHSIFFTIHKMEFYTGMQQK